MFPITDPMAALLVSAVFLLAGFIKGVAGFGLPTVTLGILALSRPLPEAMALMLVPALATNIWQALAGPALWTALRRLRGFLAAAGIGALAGAGILARSDAVVLSGVLGLLLVVSSGLALSGWPMPPPGPGRERWVSPLMGGLSGLLTGMTGSFLMPAAPYFAALRLPFAFSQLTVQYVHRRGLCRPLQKAEPFARHGVEHRRHRRRLM